MKKVLISIFVFLITTFACPEPANAGMWGDEFTTAANTNLWIIYPTEYTGNLNVYIHSTENPSGVALDTFNHKKYDSFRTDDWNYVNYRIFNLPPSEYWITLESDLDAFSGEVYPDMDFRTLLPNIDKTCNRINIQADDNQGMPGARCYNIQQFFGIYTKTEELEVNVDNLEEIMLGLLQTQLGEVYGLNGSDGYFELDIPGHYDDYVKLFQPSGCGLFQYFSKAIYSPMRNLTVGFEQMNASIFSKLIIDNNEKEMMRMCSTNVLYQSALFGWDIVFDTRNLEYNNPAHDFLCTSTFCVNPDDSLTNIFIRNFTEDIPKMKQIGKIVDVNDKDELFGFLSKTKYEVGGEVYAVKDIEDIAKIDYSEGADDSISEKDSVSHVESTASSVTETNGTRWIISTVIILCVVIGVVIGLVVLKRKR